MKKGISFRSLDISSRLGTYANFGQGGKEVMHLNDSLLKFSWMTKEKKMGMQEEESSPFGQDDQQAPSSFE